MKEHNRHMQHRTMWVGHGGRNRTWRNMRYVLEHLVQALCYTPEACVFDHQWGFSRWPNTSNCIVPLGFTLPLTKINLSVGMGRQAWGWKSYCHLWADCLENVAASTTHTLWSSTVYYRDNLTRTLHIVGKPVHKYLTARNSAVWLL
jgi:hypothetical protein